MLAILLFILEFLLICFLNKLIIFAVNGENGLDYIITRAELTGNAESIAKASGWFRAFQPVIELLLCLLLVPGIICIIDKKKGSDSFFPWLSENILTITIVLLILLAIVVFTVRLSVARQMRNHPLKTDGLPTEERFAVICPRSPGKITGLSGLSACLFFLSLMFGFGLTSDYVNHGIMLFFFLLSLSMMVLSFWSAHRERREYKNIMIIDKKGILVCGINDLAGDFIPWEEISSTSADDQNAVIFRTRGESCASNIKIVVSLKDSMIRGKTINIKTAQYRRLAESDRAEEDKQSTCVNEPRV